MDLDTYTFCFYSTRSLSKARAFFNGGHSNDVKTLRFRLFHGTSKTRTRIWVKQMNEIENLLELICQKCPSLRTVVIDAMHASASVDLITDCIMSAICTGHDDRKLEVRLEHFTIPVLGVLDMDSLNEHMEAVDTHIHLAWSWVLEAEEVASIVALLTRLTNLKGLVLSIPQGESAGAVARIMRSIRAEGAIVTIRGWRHWSPMGPKVNGINIDRETIAARTK